MSVPRRNDVLRAEVSGVILTKDEEQYLPGALRSLSWCDEVLVVDSNSTDRTCDIAKEMGARVIVHPFSNHGEQYNVGIDNAQSEWIFLLDADERVTGALAAEVRTELQQPRADVYYVPRRNYFFGRWIRFGGLYPDASIRLLRQGAARYEIRQTHPRIVTTRPTGRFRAPMTHLAYRGVDEYIDKLNRYTSWHAIARLSEMQSHRSWLEIVRSPVPPWHKLRDVTELWPGRPALRFILTYFLRLGLLDGRPGFRLAVLAAVHEYLTSLKLEELEARLPSLGPDQAEIADEKA